MASLTYSVANPLRVRVRDRATLAAFLPYMHLVDGLSSLGFEVEVLNRPDMGPHDLAIQTGEELPEEPGQVGETLGEDDFRMAITPQGALLHAISERGFAYAIWETMERLGWSWPTPTVVREPQTREWELPLEDSIHRPALKHRIFFAEEITISPDLVLWLSRLRFNTLFPSNPSRFSDPEIQVPDRSLTLVRQLGLDLIVGGHCADWLCARAEILDVEEWTDLSPYQIEPLVTATLELWSEMGIPPPRLSLWPGERGGQVVEAFIEGLLKTDPGLEIETDLGQRIKGDGADRVLFRNPLGDVASLFDQNPDSQNLGENGNSFTGTGERYLFSTAYAGDGRLGNAVFPLLWRRHLNQVRECVRLRLDGFSVGFAALPAESFLERTAFSLAVVARGMWRQGEWDADSYVMSLMRDQFEAAGEVVFKLVEDLDRWADKAKLETQGVENGASPSIQFANQILRNESIRDKLDQRISEIEECSPSQPCLELVRSLSTLVGLFDLEECADGVEAKAAARTIWTNNRVDDWPEWLRRRSLLVDRLKAYL